MKESLAKNKNDTKRLRMDKKGIDISKPVVVHKSDEEIEDNDSKDSDFNSIDDLFARLFNDDNNSVFKSNVVDSDIEIR